MLIVGPDGGLIEVEAFHAACIELFRKLGAASFYTVPAPKAQPGCTLAFVAFDKYYEIAAGRSTDEALVRLAQRVVDKGKCNECNRPAWLDDQVTAPMDPEHLDYLDPFVQRILSVCTSYFDHRDVTWKKACHGFDADVTPGVPDVEWNGDQDG